MKIKCVLLHKYFTLVRNHNMIQLEKLKYVPLNSFFAFDKENYFTNLTIYKVDT